MKITPTRPDTPAAAALLLCLSLALPATAWSDIYKWNDEQGRTIFSNVAPTPSDKAKKVQLLVKENRPAATAAAPGHVATPTEQALLGKIESLERQLQTQGPPAPATRAPQSAPYGNYYAPPPPPPPSSGYYADEYDYPSYYPNYYYPAPYYAASIFPARAFVRRPVFVGSRGGSFHRGGGGRGGRR